MQSLPSRERGSKPAPVATIHEIGESLPPRERGSENPRPIGQSRLRWSLPSRERGSKHIIQDEQTDRAGSLPHGSVDRNNDSLGRWRINCVAPLTGAWIETGSRPYA